MADAQRCEIEELVKRLVGAGNVAGADMTKFKKRMKYDDCRYYAMKFMLVNVKKNWKKEKQPIVLNLLKNLDMTNCKDGVAQLTTFHFASSNAVTTGKPAKLSLVSEHKRLYTFIWLEFLKAELPAQIHKEVLSHLPNVMKFFTSPLQLSDYLTESYNQGGVISLLALNGLFILVNSYNLDYPNFYNKVYALLHPQIFHLKYKARFLYLLDLFLSSTHLSAHLVAAFIKKMSRLLLTAPPESLLCALPMIRNWLARHPACHVLVNRPGSTAELASDPFDPNEADPMRSKAMESSLWEIKCLLNHHYHEVVKEVMKFDNLSAHEQDLSDLFELKIEELVTKELTKIDKGIAFNPPGLPQSCVSTELWQLF